VSGQPAREICTSFAVCVRSRDHVEIVREKEQQGEGVEGGREVGREGGVGR